MNRITATVHVQVTLQLPITDTWGPECTVDQVYKQAADTARRFVLQLRTNTDRLSLTIVGEPKVVGILTEEIK